MKVFIIRMNLKDYIWINLKPILKPTEQYHSWRIYKNKPEPFFLMVSIHPPHPPFSKENCPEGYWEMIEEPFIWNPNVNESDRKNRNEAMRGYLALTKNIDDNMGRLIKYLDGSNLAENTIVVFTSDHGEMMGAHGYNGKGRAYTESVNVPLIIRWPGHIESGIQTNLPQSAIDHLPTLCSMAGIDVPEPVDGIDISGLWNNKIETPKRNAVLMANYSAGSRRGLFITDFTRKKPYLIPWNGERLKPKDIPMLITLMGMRSYLIT
jgi:arylsulfatase A-like enzyme